MSPPKNQLADKIDSLWVNLHLATMTQTGPYGLIEDGALALCEGKIDWIGKRNELPADLKSGAAKVYDG